MGLQLEAVLPTQCPPQRIKIYMVTPLLGKVTTQQETPISPFHSPHHLFIFLFTQVHVPCIVGAFL